MSLLLMLTISLVVVAGVLLMLARDLFRMIVGLAVLGGAVNLIVFFSGRPGSLAPPVIERGADALAAGSANPLTQALVLTAIVIGFALLCFALVLGAALSKRAETEDADAPSATEPPASDPYKPPVLEA